MHRIQGRSEGSAFISVDPVLLQYWHCTVTELEGQSPFANGDYPFYYYYPTTVPFSTTTTTSGCCTGIPIAVGTIGCMPGCIIMGYCYIGCIYMGWPFASIIIGCYMGYPFASIIGCCMGWPLASIIGCCIGIGWPLASVIGYCILS